MAMHVNLCWRLGAQATHTTTSHCSTISHGLSLQVFHEGPEHLRILQVRPINMLSPLVVE